MNATTNTTVTVPALSTDIADLVDDLTGFHPVLDRAVAALADLATADLDADGSQSVVAALGAFDTGNVATLLGLVVRRIASPDSNPALADLPADRKQTLRRLGAEYAAALDDSYVGQLAAEASAVIEGG
ncbi:hypothetical protein OIA45_49090 (plasmid) [Streptomyces chartreusis]|uniref:hypothetical protein n=1 Tax=Streptomyces chartreusis TaxID=1969 RepID=UPI0037DCF3B4|nr:hypothetical protein OIA45_49090 [Streptomyces chartreusis]